MKEIKRGLKALLLAVLAYLTQACVMGYRAVDGVTGSVMFAVLAILTVSYGKKYAFCASCLIGMLTECMLSGVNALYLIAYPVITMLCAQAFADMSDRKRERRRNRIVSRLQDGKKRKLSPRREGDLPAHLRVVLCAGLMDLILNIALCAYMYLIGVEITFTHVRRAAAAVAYTAAIAFVLMVPLRAFLGMYPRRRRQTDKGGELL